jgi:pilus assembly protein CpaB
MKHARALSVIVLAAVLGLGAVALAANWLLAQSSGGGKRIAVAALDVEPGRRVAADAVRLVEWPAASLPDGAYSEAQKLEGRVLKSSILRGEPYTEAKLAPAGTLGGLSAVIAEGKRAITVRVNDVVGVAGFALPGNFVDIIVNTRHGQAGRRAGKAPEAEQDISKIVLERILVLAVAQEVGRDDTKPRVVNAVTLEVTPEQAEKLDLARSVGNLSLVLRNQVDPRPGVTEGATKDSMLGVRARPAPIPAPAPVRVKVAATAPRHCVGVLNGTGGMRECFDE